MIRRRRRMVVPRCPGHGGQARAILRLVAATVLATTAGAALGAPLVAGYERFGRTATDAAERIDAGLVLLGELGCVNCHATAPPRAAHILPKRGPILDGVGGRLDPVWIERYLAAPHAVKPGTTMPDLLATLPAERRAAAAQDLAQFLASTGTFDRGASTRHGSGNPGEGRAIHDRVGCAACHGSLAEDADPLPDHLRLADLDAKWSRTSLDAFLRDPLAVRPSSRMPAIQLNDDERRHVVAALLGPAPAGADALGRTRAFQGSAWHSSGGSLPDFERLGQPVRSGPVEGFDVAALAGRESEFVVRCDGFLHVPTAGVHRFHLMSDDGSRLSVAGKLVVDNDGVHGEVEREGEVTLAAGVHPIRLDYFQGGGGRALALDVTPPSGRRRSALLFVTPTADGTPAAGDGDEPDFVVDPARVDRGRAAFAALGCANCHQLGRDAAAAEPVTQAAAPLADLPAREAGCLAAAPSGRAAAYDLDDSQRQALVAALGWLGTPAATTPVRERTIARTLTALNCYACHSRDGRGGIELAAAAVDEDGEPVTRDERRDRLFTTHVKELGEEGRLPPTLTGVGDKLNPKFLREAMLQGTNDRRAYMHTRMPKWHADVVEPLAALLEQDVRTQTEPPALAGHASGDLADAGRFLVGSKALGCVKCHSYDDDRGQSLGVIALTRFPVRLRHEWFLAYVADPQKFRPGTRMPAAWPEGKVFFPDVVDGTAAGQIESVWRYLTAPDRRPPLGARSDSIELVPTDRPVLYRNFIAGAGVRAIGVGYPEKVNIAWDAETMRLGSVWKGAFIDAGVHWSGRGAGTAVPLGDGVFKPDETAAIAVLEAPEAPWPRDEPRTRGARFKGYELDAAGRPTFRWSLAGMDVSESFVPTTSGDKPGLRRVISLRKKPAGGQAVFRSVRAKTVEPLPDGWLLVDGAWRVRVQGAGEPVRREDGGFQEVRYVPAWKPAAGAAADEALVVEELSW